MLRCLIVDDSPRFLDAARGLLERQGVTVVGVASNSADALRSAGDGTWPRCGPEDRSVTARRCRR
jgi:CheY-like chemotaxis protein